MFLSLLFCFGCGDPEPESDADCVAFYDTCNAGCNLQCGTIYEKERVDKAPSCDLGCVDSEDDPECLFTEGQCLFGE